MLARRYVWVMTHKCSAVPRISRKHGKRWWPLSFRVGAKKIHPVLYFLMPNLCRDLSPCLPDLFLSWRAKGESLSSVHWFVSPPLPGTKLVYERSHQFCETGSDRKSAKHTIGGILQPYVLLARRNGLHRWSQHGVSRVELQK